MNTTAAAKQAGVTVATIRTWCRRGVVAAVKRAGRWVIDAASLTHRITLGKARRMKIQPLTRAEFEAAAARIGIRHAHQDARCHGEYRLYTEVGHTSTGAPGQVSDYDLLIVGRGAALAAAGYTPPTRTPGPGHAPGLVGDLFGSNKGADCHYCGLDARTCDCR